MSKIPTTIFLVLTGLIIFILGTTPISADQHLPKCPIQTDPAPLLSNASAAKFIINVGDNTAYGGWKVEFKCGANNLKENATVEKNGKDISYRLENSATLGQNPITGLKRCEFTSGSHKLLVKAVVGNDEVDQCLVEYIVLNAGTQCELTLDPDKNITSASTLKVSGKNLAEDGRFALFIDNERITGNLIDPGFVNTPTFSGIQIPSKYLTPTSHRVNLREHRRTNIFNPGALVPIVGSGTVVGHEYGPPLCQLIFTVGTPGQPGSVVTSGKEGSVVNLGPPLSAVALPCDASDPNNPGVQTAIGCVHTSPIGFVKDMLKFVVGIAGGLAFLMMLLGAFQMITSAGNPDTLNAGREKFANAIIGLLFVIFAVLLLQIIGVDILRIPGFGK